MNSEKGFFILKTNEEKIKIILNNVYTMLRNRIYINKEGDKMPMLDDNPDETKNYEHFEDKANGVFIIETKNGEIFSINIIFQKITATGKQSVITDFIKTYAAYKKIIIAKEYNSKILDFVTKYNTQIFKEEALLMNIIDHCDQPRFELLSPKETELVKKEYNITDYTTKKILKIDPIVKYYGLKKGDYIRIIRPSPTAGEVCDYRIVF